MYWISEKLLFIATNSIISNLEFIQSVGSPFTSLVDLTCRKFTITYDPTVHTYSEMSLMGQVIDKGGVSSLIEEVGIVLLSSRTTDINSIRYYVGDNINFISQLITDALPSDQVSTSSSEAFIIVTETSVLAPIDLATYLSLVNSSEDLHALDIASSDPPVISNFSSIDAGQGIILEVDDSYVFRDRELSIGITDLIDSFVSELKSRFPEVEVVAELNDIQNLEQKHKILRYTANLDTPQVEYATKMNRHPDMGKYLKTVTRINFEYLSDDLKSHLWTRDQLKFEQEFFSIVKFQYMDEILSEPWDVVISWDYEFTDTLDQGPETKDLDTSKLYSLKFSCRMIGYVVENLSVFPTILKNILSSNIEGTTDNIIIQSTEIT